MVSSATGQPGSRGVQMAMPRRVHSAQLGLGGAAHRIVRAATTASAVATDPVHGCQRRGRSRKAIASGSPNRSSRRRSSTGPRPGTSRGRSKGGGPRRSRTRSEEARRTMRSSPFDVKPVRSLRGDLTGLKDRWTGRARGPRRGFPRSGHLGGASGRPGVDGAVDRDFVSAEQVVPAFARSRHPPATSHGPPTLFPDRIRRCPRVLPVARSCAEIPLDGVDRDSVPQERTVVLVEPDRVGEGQRVVVHGDHDRPACSASGKSRAANVDGVSVRPPER